MSTTRDLLANVPQTGRVTWIGVAAEHRAPIESRDAIVVDAESGIEGDHHGSAGRGLRHITLCQAEHLQVIASICGRDSIDPALLRRNVFVAGINLFSVRDRRFLVGTVTLQGTGDCPPCSRMNETLGAGGFQAMRGHGGITAEVLTAGEIRIGDPVEVIDESTVTDE